MVLSGLREIPQSVGTEWNQTSQDIWEIFYPFRHPFRLLDRDMYIYFTE